MTQPLVLSLFPGIGLLDMAFEQEGFCIVRGPDLLWGGDIKRFHPPTGKFDGVIGGPPCQMFSPLSNLVRARGYEPRFGNLIPEFERCVQAAQPSWFVMEEVPQAPAPVVYPYAVRAFTFCNSALDDGDGFGGEQERVRRFSFGVKDRDAINLQKYIQLAALRLPKSGSGTITHAQVSAWDSGKQRRSSVTVTQASVNNSREAKGRVRVQAVLSDSRAVPVALGGRRKRKATVSNRSGVDSKGNGERFSIAEAIRLQGLPTDFLKDAPFTITGKRQVIANGVPLQMGRAVAKAVRQAMGYPPPTNAVDPADGGVAEVQRAPESSLPIDARKEAGR
jgi:DNA (cytosine-5)-methyltransferase 1